MMAPTDLTETACHRLVAATARVRFVMTAIGILVALAVPDSVSDVRGDRVVAYAALVYLPLALVAWLAATRRPGRVPVTAQAVIEAAVIGGLAIVVPEAQVLSMLGFMFWAVLYTAVGGRRAGTVVVLVGSAVAVTARVVAGLPSPSLYAVMILPAAMLAVSHIVGAALEERRARARFLARLQAAIAGLPATPDLEQTLRSVALGARMAVTAKFVSILVWDDRGVVQGALEGDHDPDPPERSAEIIASILEDPSTSPSGIALTTGQRVVVPVIADDPRFARWGPETERQGFTSTVAIPLRSADGVVGVVAAYFPDPAMVDDEAVDLLSAYADHAALVILRALAYEHEKRAAEQLAETEAMRSELVASVSHELRTPLTSVKGFIETVLRHWERFDDDDRRAMLGRAGRNADVLGDLIAQVIDYSRLQAGSVVPNVRAVTLADEVGQAIAEQEAVVASHEVVVHVPADLVAAADPACLSRVLANLVANAAKFSPADTSITISAKAREGNEVVVSVSDEGPGVPPAERERIFERFARREPGHGPRGLGIGLAVVKGHVEIMGGRVWVEDAPGPGATFSFSLPAAEVAARPVSPLAGR